MPLNQGGGGWFPLAWDAASRDRLSKVTASVGDGKPPAVDLCDTNCYEVLRSFTRSPSASPAPPKAGANRPVRRDRGARCSQRDAESNAGCFPIGPTCRN